MNRSDVPEPGITAPIQPEPGESVDAIQDTDRLAVPPTLHRASKTPKKSFFDKAEAYVSRLSTKNNFWHRVTSLIWLPFAFRSGIRMKRIDDKTFAGKPEIVTAILPFKRFNRNWYNAMAGAALLGNSEIAGGMYVFGVCGGDYTVVCKHLEYKFLRPCFGPALYRISPKEDIQALVATGTEFNITIDMDVCQQIVKPGEREKRVGKSTAVFHVTPKAHHKVKKARRADPPHHAPAPSP